MSERANPGAVYEVEGRRFVELDPERDVFDQAPQILTAMLPSGFVASSLEQLGELRLGPTDPTMMSPSHQRAFNRGLDQGVIIGFIAGVFACAAFVYTVKSQ